jgi:hypothetical protein
MKQFYLYDKNGAGAYNRARLRPVKGCPGAVIGAESIFLFFLITDDHSEVPTFV